METRGSYSSLPEPTELQKVRIDYAWKWFNFHAEQRTKMFNFMLIGLGIFATVVVSAIEKKLLLEAMELSILAVFLTGAFWLLDRRNRQLYKVAQDLLIDFEETVVFADMVEIKNNKKKWVPFSIARRIDFEDLSEPLWEGVWHGRHRYIMPFVALIFAVLFGLAAWQSWLLYSERGNNPQPEVAQVICCQAGKSSDTVPAGTSTSAGVSTKEAVAPTSDVIAIDGTGTIGGLHWFLVVAGLVMAAGGAVAFFKGHKIGGSVAMAAGLATSVLPNFSIPLTAQFHFDPKIEAKLANKLDLRVERLLEIVRRSQPAMLASGRFGGFGDGVELFDCNDPANRETVEKVNAAIARTREPQMQAIVLLIGGTDRKPLSQPLRRRFDSNVGLARARVSEVERCLNLAPAQGPGPAQGQPEVVRLVTGPSYTPGAQEAADVVSKKMAEDREVRTFVIGVPVNSKR